MTLTRVELVAAPGGGWEPDFAAAGLPADTSYDNFRDLRRNRALPGPCELRVIETKRQPADELRALRRGFRALVSGMIQSGNPTLAAIGDAARDAYNNERA